MIRILLIAISLSLFNPLFAAKKKDNEEKKELYKSSTYSGLKWRNVGPALTSGRIADIAVNPNNPNQFYVAAASGGVWKTDNSGVTYKPIFDSQGSYSIGCVSIAPSNEHIVWVGTGENNNQRSVAYGDGVYRSMDGGKSWKNMGLKNSEHIGKILINPNDPNKIYVAAYGPLWSAGGDRGIYYSTDGGENWERILDVSEHTGFNDIIMDPRNPEVLYAAAHQRRRHVWTYISGGPESAIYKSIDGGKNWNKLENGLPKGDVGRIGLAISPVNPDHVYAMIEATPETQGFYRSTDRGASWKKLNKYSTSGNYYVEIYPDPNNINRLYSMDTYCHYSDDEGKTWKKLNEKHKHVDNHCMWINPNNSDHYIMGCDGGIYVTYDDAANWQFHANLPVTQFYKVAVDDDKPFYNIYGGTQDNFSLGGPSRTTNAAGIVNSDWFITKGGDGFESQIEPGNPNILYAQSQYGWLVRYDKLNGEKIDIKPHPGVNEAAYRWNWDAPLLISPHNPKRLYFAANKVFRSDDRGDNWKVISDDLSRGLDRNKLPVMGRVWSMDAVAKNKSTTIYGNIVALDESPLKEDLLYAGTDDGLVHVSENAGENWSKIESFPGVPERTYVNALSASKHNEARVYAAFNNHKNGDFKPYILRSDDKGKSWTNISGDLPERGSVYDIVEDHKNENLLFAGTEFGLFFSLDGGEHWTQLKNGLPTVAIRDVEIQERENDLILASFGRGFYVLDDYSLLRNTSEELLNKEAHIFPIKDALMYVETRPLGLGGKSFQGEAYYAAENPPVGACFSYYIKEVPQTMKQKRQEEEKKIKKDGGDVFYPSEDQMRQEDLEQKPYLIFVIKDENGEEVRRLKTKASKGIKRAYWDFKYQKMSPIKLKEKKSDNPFAGDDGGHLALPGTYSVELFMVNNGEVKSIAGPEKFEVDLLEKRSIPVADRKAVLAFQKEVKTLRRDVASLNSQRAELEKRLKFIEKAYATSVEADLNKLSEIEKLRQDMAKLKILMNRDASLSKREFETSPSLNNRIGLVVWGLWSQTGAPTGTQKKNFVLAQEMFKTAQSQKQGLESKIEALEAEMDRVGVPYTPGR